MKLLLENWQKYMNEVADETTLIRYTIPSGNLFKYARGAKKEIDDESKTDLPSPYIMPAAGYREEFWFTEAGFEKYHEFLEKIVEIAERKTGEEATKEEITLPLDGAKPDYDIPGHERSRYSRFHEDSKVPGLSIDGPAYLAYIDEWQVAFYRAKNSGEVNETPT